MTRIGTGLAAIAAAVLMLGATPADACGNDQGHACSCGKDGARTAKAEGADSKATDKGAADKSAAKDGKATARTADKAAEPAPAKASTPAPAPETQSCVLRPAGEELAGKCACGGPSDCTCKKNDCQCAKCNKRHAPGEAHGA